VLLVWRRHHILVPTPLRFLFSNCTGCEHGSASYYGMPVFTANTPTIAGMHPTHLSQYMVTTVAMMAVT